MQDMQDLAQNLASLALKMKLFLQDMKILARFAYFLQDGFYWDNSQSNTETGAHFS